MLMRQLLCNSKLYYRMVTARRGTRFLGRGHRSAASTYNIRIYYFIIAVPTARAIDKYSNGAAAGRKTRMKKKTMKCFQIIIIIVIYCLGLCNTYYDRCRHCMYYYFRYYLLSLVRSFRVDVRGM